MAGGGALSEALKIVVHHGERARAGRGFAGDALMDLIAGAGVASAVTLRGVEGFGTHHRLRTDRLLTLSEDLPLVTVAVGAPDVVAPLATAAARIVPSGLITLERAALAGGGAPEGARTAKLTVHCARADAMPVAAAVRASGLAGATVLVGVDGVLDGGRRRARVLRAGSGVPCAVIAVGAAERVERALGGVARAAGPHAAFVERVNVVRRAGAAAGPLPIVPDRDPGGLGLWQRLTVVVGPEGGLAPALVRALRRYGAAGVTALRGAWADVGEGDAHAERLLALRRRAPFLLTIVETPSALVRLWPLVERATARAGLVTCELLPAVRIQPAVGPRRGGLRLARGAAGGIPPARG